jgi:hypothetical protein
MGREGHGITVSASGFSGEVLAVKPAGWSRGTIDLTHQGTTEEKDLAVEALQAPGQATLRVAYSAGLTIPTTKVQWTFNCAGASGTGGGSAGGTITFYGTVTSVDYNDFVTGSRMEATITIQKQKTP